jgi:hypothetical protein
VAVAGLTLQHQHSRACAAKAGARTDLRHPKTGLPFVKRVPFLNHAGEPDFGNMTEIVFVLATALLVWFTFTYTG